jgi:hypothetical protein
MRSGFAVIGDTQHLLGRSLLLLGRSLLLTDDASASHLSDLGVAASEEFLFDLSLLGETGRARLPGTACAGSTTRCSAAPFLVLHA